MKNSYKVALLVALGLASGTASQAAYVYGDLVLGVAQASGPQNAANIDIGTLANLESVGSINLTSQLAADGFSASLNSAGIFGIVGYTVPSGTLASRQFFLSIDSNSPNTPPTVTTSGDYLTLQSGMSTLVNNQGQVGYNGGQDYFYQTQVGNNGLTDALGFNPSSVLTDTANLYTIQADGSNPVLAGTLSFDPTSEILSFSAVPEPTTLSLMGGAGVLMLVFRNKLSRKQT